MAFYQITIPAPRFETPEARRFLSRRFGFLDRPVFQDWERHFANAERLPEFLAAYSEPDLSEDAKFLLMALILASASAAGPKDLPADLWRDIMHRLRENPGLHGRTIWDWASIEEETGLPLNDFVISPELQSLMLELPEVFFGPGAALDREPMELAARLGAFWWRHFDTQPPTMAALRTAFPSRYIQLPKGVWPAKSVDWLVLNQRIDAPLEGATPCRLWIDPEHGETVAYLAKPPGFHRAGSLDQNETPPLWVSAETGAVFAFGPEGVDAVLAETVQRDALAKRYSSP